jgi:pimeloyl-ACP methyl ester carboxylesterase
MALDSSHAAVACGSKRIAPPMRGPFVLVGHAFGGPIVRNYAKIHPNEVADIVFVDAVSEDQRFEMWQ